VLENARIEQVSDRVDTRKGDARELPFANETFDIVVSSFVVHEMNNREEREK
jgi:ubiquinone/menaquinone biosynthesis C-methylase UbiE